MQSGGRIKKPRKKKEEVDPKIQEALQKQLGGRVRRSKKYHSKEHQYLMEKLTGRGGALDSAECRRQMYHIMKKYPSNIWHTYMNSKVTDNSIPFMNDHHTEGRKPRFADPRAHVISTGGSLRPITHSENGFLLAHDSRFYGTSTEI